LYESHFTCSCLSCARSHSRWRNPAVAGLCRHRTLCRFQAESAGGRVAGIANNSLYRYDPVANTWTNLASMPTALYDGGIAYAANLNKVYVFGGYDGSNIFNNTQIYDIATDSWSVGAPLPDARFFPSALYYSGNGKIYVITDSIPVSRNRVRRGSMTRSLTLGTPR
jgi:Kelch motif/Galactose oxidase, central domain